MTSLLEQAVGNIADPVNREHCLKACHDALLDQMLGITSSERALTADQVTAELAVCSRMSLALRSLMSEPKGAKTPPMPGPVKRVVHHIPPPIRDSKPAQTP